MSSVDVIRRAYTSYRISTSAGGARIELLAKSALMVRYDAALKLVAAGKLDPHEALAFVCWPPKGSRLEDERVPLERQFYPADVREEIRRRHAAGETLPELSQRTGIRFSTVKSMIQEGQRSADKRVAKAR